MTGDEGRPFLDRWLERAFGDEESGRLGTGWLSGTASVFLGAQVLLSVLVLWFPEWLTTKHFRSLYPLPIVRALIQVVIAAGFVTGCISMLLRRRKVLGLTGGALSLLAALLGGGGVPLPETVAARPTLGLDWFLLNLFLLALLFVPLERFFPRLPEQGTFRLGWTTDSLHFFMSHLLVQVLSFLILLPAVTVSRFWEFHHWHHAAAEEARDRNFAVHLPWLDRLFGTRYLPGDEWPRRYGIAGDPVPEEYLGQLVYPFRRPPPEGSALSA